MPGGHPRHPTMVDEALPSLPPPLVKLVLLRVRGGWQTMGMQSEARVAKGGALGWKPEGQGTGSTLHWVMEGVPVLAVYRPSGHAWHPMLTFTCPAKLPAVPFGQGKHPEIPCPALGP